MHSNEMNTKPTTKQKWRVAFTLASGLGVLSYLYILALNTNSLPLQNLSFVFAAVASLLFATSLSIGSASYYTNLINVRSGYQKQIGILAFWVACLYCLTLPVLYPEIYFYGFTENLFSADILLGLIAMGIFTVMVLINSKLVSDWVTFETIKFVLGLGYVGYALLVIRAILLDWSLWETWFLTMETFPPGRLILSVIAMAVLLLRVSIPVHKLVVSKI